MSVSHTGRLTAVIDGVESQFDGEQWTTQDPKLTLVLNLATSMSPKNHSDIRQLAEHVIGKLGLVGRSRIISWFGDPRDKDLPDRALD